MKNLGWPVLLVLVGIGLLVWAALDHFFQGSTTAPLGGIWPGVILIVVGIGVVLRTALKRRANGEEET
ncbi:hypothetical protein E7T06_18390 [Deinococcus sp. Arct2-2]|uniref:hypothetical protein n=1 Tax=Deinococcus sp. Arct2-2 TaxID=2568653 RepID=UPI0010A477B4|nr:hypothetical protein [Deinococcus sp. Arct2-2]THF68009.1 hypothetical protein E7T06_18390 [Deinococcus sp. Arct2-2]